MKGSAGRPPRLTACGVQFDCRLHEPGYNAEFIAAETVRAAAEEGARLVIFPEAALTGYVFESEAEALEGAVEADGPEILRLVEACRDAAAWAVAGAVERDDGRVYNTAFLVGPEGVVGRYRKVHTLCLGVDRFAGRGAGFDVWDLPIGRIGLNICYDGTFPESSRTLKLLGAQLIVLPTNWPRLDMKRAQTTMRAYENHLNYFAVNRVGVERGTRFPGGSMAVDPLGRILAEGDDGPCRIVADFDMAAADANHVVVAADAYEFDYEADRRPAAYGPITSQTPAGTATGSAGASSAGAAEPATT
ncbi:MAG: carbon-nitrogen hydrolase family protein [Gemmatimonadales bacterium]